MTQTPRRPGHPDLLRRRADRVPRGDRGRLPTTTVQTCVVHLIRRSLRYVPRRELEKVAKDLKPIYTATDHAAAWAALEAFDAKWVSGSRRPCKLAGRLGALHPVPGVHRRGPPRRIHDKRGRGAQPAAAQGDQDQRQLPLRGRREKAALPRDPERDPQWTRTRAWTKAMLAFKIKFGDRIPDAT